jgi:hypothetical protein
MSKLLSCLRSLFWKPAESSNNPNTASAGFQNSERVDCVCIHHVSGTSITFYRRPSIAQSISPPFQTMTQHHYSSADRLLCTHYPELTDIWMNHLLLFLLPHTNTARRNYTTTVYELQVYHKTAYKYSIRNSPGWRFARVYTSQILPDHVFLYVHMDPYSWPARYMLHFTDDGHLHCVKEDDPFNRNGWMITLGRQMLHVDRDPHLAVCTHYMEYSPQHECYRFQGYGHEPKVQKKLKSVCLTRWVMLHDIRQNRI